MLIEKFKRHRRDTPTKHGSTRAAATINRELSVLSKIFSMAISEKLIASNPCREVKLFRVRNQRLRYATPEEEMRLMSSLTGFRLHLAPLVTVALYAGLRRSELFDLQWEESIDFGLGVVRVTKSKTESGKRTVPMNSLVLETLKELERVRTNNYVFPSPKTGGRLVDVKTGFRKACADAGIHNFVFHDLRHTFGTRLADAGVDVVKIKELMGHASITTTMRYMHASDEGKRAAVNKLPSYRLGAAWQCHPIVTNEKQPALRLAVNR